MQTNTQLIPYHCDIHLIQEITTLQCLDIAPTTRRTYHARVQHFTTFCKLYSISPWLASDTTLRWYCVHVYCSLPHSTILVYLAAVRHYHIEYGYQDPLLDGHLWAYISVRASNITRVTGGGVRLPLIRALP